MKRYKLYLEGLNCYKLTQSRNSKAAAEIYQRNAIITNMHGRIVSAARLNPNGTAYNVEFDKNEVID